MWSAGVDFTCCYAAGKEKQKVQYKYLQYFALSLKCINYLVQCAEVEFLDMDFTKDSSLLLHAVHSLF